LAEVELAGALARAVLRSSGRVMLLLLTVNLPSTTIEGLAAMRVCMYMTFSMVCICASEFMPAMLVLMPQLLAYALPEVWVLVYDHIALMSPVMFMLSITWLMGI